MGPVRPGVTLDGFPGWWSPLEVVIEEPPVREHPIDPMGTDDRHISRQLVVVQGAGLVTAPHLPSGGLIQHPTVIVMGLVTRWGIVRELQIWGLRQWDTAGSDVQHRDRKRVSR